MIDEVSDILNGKVNPEKKARRRGSKATHSEAEKAVIKRAWSSSTESQIALPDSIISERSAKTLPCQSGDG